MLRFAAVFVALHLTSLEFGVVSGKQVMLEVDAKGEQSSMPGSENQCAAFEVSFRNKGHSFISEATGGHGGAWSPCTYLNHYGLDFSPQFAKFLTHQLKPRSALEFGCGLGTTLDYVARFASADATCIEPKATLGTIFKQSPMQGEVGTRSLKQLALDIFSDEADARACTEKVSKEKVDLVFSLEVAEHIPAKFHPNLVKMLVEKTGKWLVFSAAGPNQGGAGHLPESSLTSAQWQKIFEDAGLVYMEGLTKIAREAAYWHPQNAHDLFTNTLVFKHPDNTASDSWMPAQELLDDPLGGLGNSERPKWLRSGDEDWSEKPEEQWPGLQRARTLKLKENHEEFAKTLWPELHQMSMALNNGTMHCDQAASLVRTASLPQHAATPVFQSAYAERFFKPGGLAREMA